MGFFDAIILGVVQGLTEFIPISSTGHLILARHVLGLPLEGSLAFDALLHFATALAIVTYFWRDILMMVRYPSLPQHRVLFWAIAYGTIPAALLGALINPFLETYVRSPWVVVGALIFGSLLFVYAERRLSGTELITGKRGFWIGLFQALALIPGMSRSGSSIAGGLIFGMSREAATRFSFLLGVPILLGAGMLKIFELIDDGGNGISGGIAVLGAGVAFVVGLAAIRWMVRFVRTRTLYPFVVYRIALALLVVPFLLF